MNRPQLLLAVVFAGSMLAAHEGHGKKNAPAAAKNLKSPLSAAQAKPALGQPHYDRVCASCHGQDGQSMTPAAAKMTIKPTNLVDHRMDSMMDGEVYWVITHGIGKQMPASKDQLSEVERWQVVLHVRELRKQRKGKPASQTGHH